MSIVPVSEMPKPPVVRDAPTDDLAALFKLAQRMRHLCSEEEGIGLAATQVGIPWRMFITDVPERGLEVFINCEYEPADDRRGWSMEGCLSVPKGPDGQRPSFVVLRNASVRFRGQRLVWEQGLALEPVDEVVEGFRAVVLQHETDHGLGRVIWEVGKPVRAVASSRPGASQSRA